MVYEEEQPYSLLLTCTLIYSCFYQPRFIKETEVGIGVVAVVDIHDVVRMNEYCKLKLKKQLQSF